ncbi:hypothetical protein AB1Y20_005285 [Prymnesium parvum]|uniref:Glycosyltransferase family 92 protein n=1 Tax=Prymnesium parvum TaxID=97485 RepID=A0AB34J5F2_PRYPA|mmetsp:Transcript_5961/g.15160  ORF Transcript_5961/g.15160 Transcript_5961/m.15160 type:complete len:270 (+) Transcript_5961:29-838(+)
MAGEEKRHACVFTIVRSEAVFLPIWYRYYSEHFCVDDIYVLHHVVPSAAEPDTCTASLRCHVLELRHEYFDPVWLRRVVCEQQRALLERYYAVLFAEVDEIVIAAPLHASAGPGLKEYVDEFVRRREAHTHPAAVRCVGWEVHHDFSSEAPIDLEQPVLAQRRYWHRNELYDKTLLTLAPLRYSLGFHTCEEEAPYDEKLVLLHLNKLDFGYFIRRHEERAAMVHSQEAIENGWNQHYRTTGAPLLKQYIATPYPTEPIPEWLRAAKVV